MGLTTEQLAERRNYLGGSDAPALAGVNPPGWSQPIDVWIEKRPDLAGEPPRRTSALMGMGSIFEDDVLELLHVQTGLPIRRVHRPVHSKRWPWMGGHLDGTAPQAIVEAKWQAHEKGFGPSMWADGWLDVPPEVPAHYMLQVQHYLAVTSKPVAYVGLLLGYAEFRSYRIAADPELQDELVELERRFWHEHVLTGVPPEPDGSESYGRMIASLQRQDRGSEQIATPEQAGTMLRLQAVVAEAKRWAKEDERLRQVLKLSMADHASLIGNGFSATYRAHEVRTVDWKAAARWAVAAMLDEAGARKRGSVGPEPTQQEIDERLARLAERYTSTRVDRPFRPKWDNEQEEELA